MAVVVVISRMISDSHYLTKIGVVVTMAIEGVPPCLWPISCTPVPRWVHIIAVTGITNVALRDAKIGQVALYLFELAYRDRKVVTRQVVDA